LCWESTNAIGREALLEHVERECAARAWPADFHVCVRNWDFELIGDAWHSLRIHTATEELGWPRRFTRCRIIPVSCPLTRCLTAGMVMTGVLAVYSGSTVAMLVVLAIAVAVLVTLMRSLRRCVDGAGRLMAHCAKQAELVEWRADVSAKPREADGR
jgi:hypothetical protein